MPALNILQLSISLFFAILFLQSGLDKIFDRKGNLSWLNEHFAQSPLRNSVPLLLTTITLLEVSAGACAAIGAGAIAFGIASPFPVYGIILSNFSLLCLFFGQRLAKDYDGAANLVPYYLTSLVGLFITS